MHDSWKCFMEALETAVRRVGPHYFAVDRYQAPATFRERVYCYELYHQLRVALGDGFPFTMHGEIDKRGHEAITERFGGELPNPDFIVHRPGTMENLAVIEVKRSDCGKDEATRDLGKLSMFIDRAHYQHGIWLAFGPTEPVVPAPARDRVLILWHAKVGDSFVSISRQDSQKAS